MWFCYQLVNNYALALVIFTLITRILLFPLSLKQQRSQAAMTAFQPKIEKLRKQYGNNQQKFQEEQMKLYQEEGINPMASCLPLLIQMPILFGIIDVVYRPLTHILRIRPDVMEQATEIAAGAFGDARYFSQRPELYVLQSVQQQPELYAHMPDFLETTQSFKNTLFGFIDLGQIPTFRPDVWDAAAVGLIVIAISSGLLNLVQTIFTQRKMKKSNPDSANNPTMKSMNIMLYGMPLFSVWIATTFPAGIGFYWAISAFLALIQSVILYKIYTPEYLAVLAERDKQKNKSKTKKRSGLMEKYQAMLEEQNAKGAAMQTAVDKNRSAPAKAFDEDGKEVKLSKSKQREYESKIIAEARRKMAEKYGDEYTED